MNENAKILLQIGGSALVVAYLTSSQVAKSVTTTKDDNEDAEDRRDAELVELEKIKQIESSGDDLTALLDNLDDLQPVNERCETVLKNSYVFAANRIRSELIALKGDKNKLKEFLDNDVKKFEQLLIDKFVWNAKDLENIYASELWEAREILSFRKKEQVGKALSLLKRSYPELPMIIFSSLLSIWSGALNASRFYYRSTVFQSMIASVVVPLNPSSSSTASSWQKQLTHLILYEVLASLVSVAKEQTTLIGKQKFIQNLKKDLFASVIKQDLGWFDGQDLFEVRHLIGNADYICGSLLSLPISSLETLSGLLTSIRLLFKSSGRLTMLLFLVLFPTRRWIEYVLDRTQKKMDFTLSKRTGFSSNNSLRIFNEVWNTLIDPNALKTMRVFAHEPSEVLNYSRALKMKDVSDKSAVTAHQLIEPLRNMNDEAINLLGMFVGGRLIQNAQMKIADLPSFVSTASDVFNKFRMLIYTWRDVGENILEPAERMYDLIHSKPSIGLDQGWEEGEGGGKKIFLEGGYVSSIRFDRVCFKYPSKLVHHHHNENGEDLQAAGSNNNNNNKTKYILNNVTFEIHGGERIGIMGESGSGKSTLFNLIERLYDANEGVVEINGKNIKSYVPLSLRDGISLVSQNCYFSRRTIRENLLFGIKTTVKEEEIENALKLCRCEFVLSEPQRFPKGLFTDVGVNGSKLSGGEKQRIALARAMLKQPKLLLLDEHTSALDENLQRNIQDAIHEIYLQSGKQLIIISIAHRLSNFRFVDRVIVLSSKGEVAEIGSPKQLLENNGVFAGFVKTSQLDFLHA